MCIALAHGQERLGSGAKITVQQATLGRFLHDRPEVYGQRAAHVETYFHAVAGADL
jgi:hypothetical protein